MILCTSVLHIYQFSISSATYLPSCRWHVGLFASTVNLPWNRLFCIWHKHQRTVKLLMKIFSSMSLIIYNRNLRGTSTVLVELQTLQVVYWIHGFLVGFFCMPLLYQFNNVTSNSIVFQFTVCVVPYQRLCKNLGKLSILAFIAHSFKNIICQWH